MWGPGGPSCGVRFVCHAITAMGGFGCLTSYNKLNALSPDLLDALEDGHTLVRGFQINGMVGTALFAWNFLQFGVSPFIRGVLLFFTGVIDLGFAIVLSVGSAKVAAFLPTTNGKCGGALDWKNAADGRNLFDELVLDGHYDDGTSACKSMLLGWILIVVSIVFYYIVAIMNMAIGYFCVAPDKYGTKCSWGSFPQLDLPKRIGKPIFSPVIIAFDASIGSIIFTTRLFRRVWRLVRVWCQLIPQSIVFTSQLFRRVWYRVRVWFQLILQSNPCQIQTKSQAISVSSRPCAVGRASTGTLPLEIVRMIAQHSHHADLISVSQSSRLLRTSFFGDVHVKDRLDALKEFTCDGGMSSCAVCGSQICPSCTIDDHDAETSTPLRHLKLCKPHCISCYWDLRCGPKRWEKYTRSPDHQRLCHVTEPVGSRSTSMSRPGTYYYGAAPRQPATTRICRLCLDRPVELRRRVVEVGDKEAAGLAWRGRLECAACREPLGRWSLVWWVCSWCGGDCADGIHPLTGNRKQ